MRNLTNIIILGIGMTLFGGMDDIQMTTQQPQPTLSKILKPENTPANEGYPEEENNGGFYPPDLIQRINPSLIAPQPLITPEPPLGPPS